MANRIVLISDDSDFFEYIKTKLELRKSDELFVYAFDEIPAIIHLLETSVLIVNSENAQEKTIDLLKIFKGTPIIVTAYNEDEVFKRKCYRAGMFDFITLLTPDSEFRVRMLPALSVASILEKNRSYRSVLVENNILKPNSEIYFNYERILDRELEEVHSGKKKAVFGAISPSDKTKFTTVAEVIETIILNNIRKNDILMNYAPSKYFIILFDSDLASAQKLWLKITEQMPQKIHAGLSQITNQNRQQLIDEVLNKLHQAINNDKDVVDVKPEVESVIPTIYSMNSSHGNFKLFRQEFLRKLEQVIAPVFYQVQQRYSGKFTGIAFEQGVGEGYGTFYIKGKYSVACFRVTAPGFSKINIDITFQQASSDVDVKRITLEPEELESGVLEDLLEQFIAEYKRSLEYDS